MIKLFNVIVDPKVIIGVGPLLRREDKEYNVQIAFTLYTRSNTIEISTGWIPTIVPDDRIKHLKEIVEVKNKLSRALLDGEPLSLIF